MYHERGALSCVYMIARLAGEVVEVMVAQVVVDVGGVGYLVSVTNGSGYGVGERITLYTHLAVRENAMDMYGFGSREELRMFQELIKIPKIGPKTALQILSQTTLVMLAHAVRTDDPTYLSKMSGMGKKSAEKIVSGLRDVLDTEGISGEYTGTKNEDSDVIDALIVLGYSQRDAFEALQRIPPEITETNERIKYALKAVGS